MSTAVQEFALALMKARAIKSSSTNDFIKAHSDALKMEKEQIKDAWAIGKYNSVSRDTSEQYYKETFKSE